VIQPDRVEQLALRHALRPDAVVRLRALLDLLDGDPHTPSAVTAPEQAIDIHLGDSLSALELEPLRAARRIVDIGSGAGLPGLALAIALPQAQVALVESLARRCDFLERACVATATANARVVNARVEAWPDGIGDHDVATARAVGPLALLCEYAAPLLALGGTLVAWKGFVSEDEQAAGKRAAGELGLEPAGVVRSRPYSSSQTHHLHMYVKTTETPSRFPRRPGIARKRPLGAPR
jgi:16S rRNA (guanine527-N7)-methyltransferase